MRLVLETPTQLYIHDLEGPRLTEVKTNLTYRDKKVQYEIQRLKNSRWFNPENDGAKLEALKAKLNVCLLEQDVHNEHHTLSGMRSYLEGKYQLSTEVRFQYPEPATIPWYKAPEKKPYPYQVQAKDNLLVAKHARVEMGTGLGKSFIILTLVKDLGLKTVVMAPSQNIAEQLHEDFLAHFGKKYVGQFFDGKKDYKKLFVIGTGQSLTRVDPESPVGQELAKVKVFVADESHQCPAATLAKVCTGVLQNAPYRFFFSATQMRNDGLDLLLDAITGPTVYEMTVREGVDQGYLAKPVFRMIRTRSDKFYDTPDANEMTREHLYYNPLVLMQAAEVINQSVETLGHQVLVLIDEVEQFTRMLPYLKHRVQFAHGPLQPCACQQDSTVTRHNGNACKVPKEYRDVDNADLVKRFNACEFPILFGTSAVSTGTDIRSCKTMVYLKGGKSEIEVRQGVGRCTRLMKEIGKTACTIVDFDVENVDTLHRHAVARRKIFDDIYGPVDMIDWR